MTSRKQNNRRLSFSTRGVHAGEPRGGANEPVNVPVYLSSTFRFSSEDELRKTVFQGKKGYVYTREGNPTNRVCEKKTAELEGGEDAMVCASGMAAISGTFFALAKSGDHVVSIRDLYGRAHIFLNKILPQAGVSVTFVKTGDFRALEKAVRRNTRVIYFETPTNPLLSIVDITAVAQMAKKHKLTSVIDNTFATPFNQKPLEMGVDVSLHSASKYLNGHSDLIAGVVVGKRDFISRCREAMKTLGSPLDPFGAYLLTRGLKTLSLRMQKHNENGMKVSRFLKNHPKIAKVFYPGLVDHPDHELARKQMKGFSGMVSFVVKGGDSAAKKMLNRLQIISRAASLGGVESLISMPASTSHYELSPAERLRLGIEPGFVRLSCGIEDIQDLIEDLEQALNTQRFMRRNPAV